MKKTNRGIILTASILVCTVNLFGCGKTQIIDKEEIQSEITIEETEASETEDDEESSEEFFYEEAGKQGIEKKEAKEYWEMLLADNVLKDDSMMLTGLVMRDMDNNGQKDLLVMLLNREEKSFYGSGCVWIYMNEDEPYCFEEEDASYYGEFDSFAEDDSDRGIDIAVYQETEKNEYSAYCDYLKENIYFHAENVFEPEEEAVWVGANARGFFNLHPVKYKGKNALQASEYLYGEGGIVQCVATAQFIILWDENGNAYIEKWWIEEDGYAKNMKD